MSDFDKYQKGLRQCVEGYFDYNISDITNFTRSKMHKTWNHQQSKIDSLQKQVELLEEFMVDCSVSHNETRYKYRAIAILEKLKQMRE